MVAYLLTDIVVVGREETDKDGDGALLDDDPGLLRGARGDVGKGPGGFELELRVVVVREELDEAGNDSGGDDLLDGGVALNREELPELGGALELLLGILGHHAGDHLG